MDSITNLLVRSVLNLLLSVSYAVLLPVYRAFIISVYWRWFIVSSFGVPELPVVAAFAVIFLLSMFGWVPTKKELSEMADSIKDPDIEYDKSVNRELSYRLAVLEYRIQSNQRKMDEGAFYAFVIPTVVLVVGWLVYMLFVA